MEPQPLAPGFAAVTFDPAQCRADLDAFEQVLAANPELSERDHILPFFRAHPQLALLLGTYNANIVTVDRLAFELSLFGQFTADGRLRLEWRRDYLIVNSRNVYCCTFDELARDLRERLNAWPITPPHP